MQQIIHATLLTLTAALIPSSAFGSQDHDVQASPFDGLRWEEDAPQVLVQETWYVPLSIDGIEVQRILDLCAQRWPGKVQKRFGEDLVEAMTLVGWKGDLEVDLELQPVQGGERVRLIGVAMTRDKRNALRDADRKGGRIRRTTVPSAVPRARAQAVLASFKKSLNDQFAYLELRGVDLDEEIATLDRKLPAEVPVWKLSEDMHLLMMRFGDGHARVSSPAKAPHASDDRYLPFLLQRTAKGVVAFDPERKQLINPAAPVIEEIDGLGMAAWIDVVRPVITAGSPQLIERRALRELREIDSARRMAGLPTGVPVRVKFRTSEAGPGEREFELSSTPAFYGPWPRRGSGRLEDNFGYLRIARMDGEVDALGEAMSTFKDTRGLVVDVRGNGGGSRELLIALGGYLVPAHAPALVGNVAAYRKAPHFGDHHLEARFMYRAAWEGWNDAQREAIAAFAPTFEPEWELPKGFSEWHYLVLSANDHPSEFVYGRPVVVLCDTGCFSATDIFLGALELLPSVTLVGTSSSGGSARSQSLTLDLEIEVKCASMASFRPKGLLYDGRGIEVDVEVWPEPGDLLQGGGDAQLDAALEVLRAAGD